jgi:structural maintenance of chromosome 4
MLFVFGYRASKMRQGKLSELIHNSEGSEDLDSCSVEVWFEEIIDKVRLRDWLPDALVDFRLFQPLAARLGCI